MAEYNKLCERLILRGENDAEALLDAFEVCRGLEVEGSSRVITTDRYNPEVTVYNDENFKAAHEYIKSIRALAAKWVKETGASDMADLYKRCLLFDAPHSLDEFMLYVEFERPPQQQFWLPRREKLKHVAQALTDMEHGGIDELFLSQPPRTGKSTLMIFFSLWCMLRDPERSNLYCSYADGVVNAFYTGLLEILHDPYTYAWNIPFPTRRLVTTNAKQLTLNIDRPKRYSSFTGRSLYGTLNGACDCNGYEIADDLVSGIEEAMNKDRLDNCWLKVDNNYLPRGKEGSRRLWIGTRWAQADPQARRMELLENDDRFTGIRWKSVNTPALSEKDESNFDYQYGVGFSTEYYLQRRASFERNNDTASWFAQYQGVPVDRSGSVFEPDDLRYYNGVLPEGEPDRIFMAVDPAWGGGDFVASPVCYQYDDDIYVVDVVYDNGDKTITQPLIVSKIEKHGVQAVTVEATRTTAGYTEGINDRLHEKGLRVNVRSSTKSWAGGTGKDQRIFDKAPDIREHMIFLESGKRDKAYEQFMQNLYAFKYGAKKQHDDAPDSLVQAINMAYFMPARVEVLKRLF